MLRKMTGMALLLAGMACLVGAQTDEPEPSAEPAFDVLAVEDVSDVLSEDLTVGDDPNKRYFLIGPKEDADPPEAGYSLLIVLPGEEGAEQIHPFVKGIFKHALGGDYLLVQIVPVKWQDDQKILWPIVKSPLFGQEFTTEELVEAVLTDVRETHRLNPDRIFTLAWSEGGPAAYAVSLQKEKLVRGSLIAMSPFKASGLPLMKRAKGQAYFLHHSPQDKVAPFRKINGARALLTMNGAMVKVNTYQGGHGWYGDVYATIGEGVAWLERASVPAAPSEVAEKKVEDKPKVDTFLTEGFEKGTKKDRPTGWWTTGPIEGVSYVWDSEEAYEGKKSVSLTKFIQKTYPVADWHKTVTRRGDVRRLMIGCKIKARRVARAAIEVQFVDDQDKVFDGQQAIYVGRRPPRNVEATHNWKEYVGVVDIPEGTKKLRFALQMHGSGMIWYDDFRVAYLPQ
jgi:hypothetical protein